MLANNLGTVTGLVFIDATGDGLTAGEQVSGATMEIYRDINGNGQLEVGGADGLAVATTQTNGSGVYRFDGLTADSYIVRQLADGGRGLTEQASGPIAISALDAQGVTGITIDSFNTTTQSVSASGGGSDESSVTPAPDALGNERDMFVQVTSVGGQLDLQANDAVAGVLAAGGLGSAMGPRTVTWDGLDNDGANRAFGLGAVDLTSSGQSTAIQLMIGGSEAGGMATMRVFTDANQFSTAVVNIPQTPTGGPTGEVILDFTQAFADAGVSGGANFGNVNAIEFELDSDTIDVDMQMDFVGTIGPTVFTSDFDNFEPVDLELVKTVNNAAPDLFDNVTFTLTLSHVDNENDNIAATNVQVTDMLPAGLTFVGSNPSQGNYNETTGIWTVGTVAAGANATLMITASVDTPGPKTNVAEVTAVDQFDTDSTPNNNVPAEDDQDDATVEPALIDLELSKTIDNATPNVGENVEFTITVQNVDADTAASGVQVRDQLPAGMTLVSNSASQGDFNTTTGVWTVGNLAAGGGSATLTLIASVDQQGARTNTAEVIAADQSDVDSTPNNDDAQEDDQDSADLNTPVADLSLTKTVSDSTPSLNDTVQFTITVSNDGPDPATGVSVLDELPMGLTFVSSTESQGDFNAASGIWTVGSLGVGGSATLLLNASVDTLGLKTNVAQVFAANEADIDSTPNNDDPTEDDQDSADVDPVVVDLELTKTVDNETANVGENVTFTITVQNTSNTDATGVAVADTLPAGLTFVSSNTVTGAYNSATGVWTIGALNAAATATLDIVATVATPGTKVNVAEISATNETDQDSTPGNGIAAEDDQDDAQVTPPQIDLELTKSVDNATPNLNSDVTFTISLVNQGPDDATGVEVTDVLPAGLTFVSSNPSQGDYNDATGVWTVGALNNAATATLSIVATVATSGTKVNVAEVTAADQFDVDSTPDNDLLAEDDQDDAEIVTDPIDLRISKTDSPDPVSPGEQITYEIIVVNDGPGDATGVTVTETLPAGVTFVSDTTSVGSYDEATNVWTIGDLANTASATLTLVVSVDAGVTGDLTNVVEVSANETEERTDNNRAETTTTVNINNASLAGFVYVDSNNNGVKDPTEPGIMGVTVTLIGPNGLQETAVTDDTGAYLFENLAPGEYMIQETQPTSFRDGQDNAESGLTGDPDGITTQNDMFEDVDLAQGVNGVNFNFGELPATISKRRFLASS